MKKSRFTDSQISEALKRVEAGLAVPEICRELGVSTATFYKWRAKYGGMDIWHPQIREVWHRENAQGRVMQPGIQVETVST